MLAWVARGKTNPEIARILWLAPSTVSKHLANLYAKLGVKTGRRRSHASSVPPTSKAATGEHPFSPAVVHAGTTVMDALDLGHDVQARVVVSGDAD